MAETLLRVSMFAAAAVVTDFAYLLSLPRAAAPPGAFDIGRFNDMLLRSMRASSFRHAGPGSGRTTKSIMSNDRYNRTTKPIFFPDRLKCLSSATLKVFFVELDRNVIPPTETYFAP